MTHIDETIPDGLDGERVDRVVAMITSCSRAEAASLVASGAVTVDGRVVTTRSVKLTAGQVVHIDLPEGPTGPPVAGDATIALAIVHVDDDVIVIDKPAGLVVHPGSGNADGTLVNGLVAAFPEIAEVGEPERPGIVHRIDKGTSGLLVVARSKRAHDSLTAQMAAHSVEREYAALVWGQPESTHGVIDAAIGRSGRDPTRMAVSNRGRPARTHYEVVSTFDSPAPVAVVRCRLETGRTHQIRVHMAAIGHPVVGDDRYGGGRSSIPMTRPWLHAARLGFDHPATEERVSFDSPLPPDLTDVLATLS
ncbi:MAG: RluA family pseudouridine synthase [Acidimicrobiia bacterium]|nr:RluA family pseudouridine synthase [Acidimicrobiia bacterium]